MTGPGRSRSTFLGAAASLLFTLPATADAAPPAVDAETLRDLRVYALNPRISTIVAVTPASLLRFPGVVLRRHDDRATIEETLAAIARARPLTGAPPFDVRFGLIYDDARGTRRFEAFADRFARYGLLGGRSVRFDDPPALLAVLRRAAR